MKGARHVNGSEVARLLGAAFDPRLRMLVALLGYTGGRISEVLALRWGDVSGDWIRFRRSTTKGETEGRLVPVSAELAAELGRYRETFAPLGLVSPGAHVLPGVKGSWSRPAASRSLARLVSELGLAKVSAHSLRKHFVTSAMEGGASIHDAARLVGHRNLRTTQAYVEDPGPDRLRSAVDLVASSVRAGAA